MFRLRLAVACLALLLSPLAAYAGDDEALKQAEKAAEKPTDKPAEKPSEDNAKEPAERPARRPEPPQRTPRFMPGAMAELKKVEQGSITLQPLPPQRFRRDGKPVESDKRPPAEEQTLTVDEKTMIGVPVHENEREVNGRKVRTTRFARGSPADLKVGQKVMFAADGDRAVRISIMPAEPPPAGDGL